MTPSARGAAGSPRSVLFVCSQNVVRSPMAEALARGILGPDVYVASAGMRAGEPDPFAAAAMREIGCDLGSHQPRSLDDLDDTGFDLIVTLAPDAHRRVLELTRTLAVPVVYWPTADPTAVVGSRSQIMDAYRTVRDALRRRIVDCFTTA